MAVPQKYCTSFWFVGYLLYQNSAFTTLAPFWVAEPHNDSQTGGAMPIRVAGWVYSITLRAVLTFPCVALRTSLMSNNSHILCTCVQADSVPAAREKPDFGLMNPSRNLLCCSIWMTRFLDSLARNEMCPSIATSVIMRHEWLLSNADPYGSTSKVESLITF